MQLKFVCLLLACLAALTAAAPPLALVDQPENYVAEVFAEDAAPVLVRRARSPEGGSASITYSKDQRGREAGLQYNHNLFTSKDGRGSIDAYANANRNFDQNRNSYGGGIQGKWRF